MDLTREDMEKHLESLIDDNEKIDGMNYYASKVYQTDEEYAEKLTDQALNLSRKLSYQTGIAQALLNKALLLFNRGDFQTMLEYITESEDILRRLPDGNKLGLHRVVNCKAICYYYQGNYNQAAAFFKESINLCRDAGDAARLGNVYSNLSAIYEHLGQYEKAREYTIEAIEVLKNTTDYYSRILAMANHGIYSTLLHEYSEAVAVFQEGLLLARDKHVEAGEAMILSAMAGAYLEINEYSKSEDAAQKCLELSISRGYHREEISALLEMSKLFMKTGRLDQAEEYLFKVLGKMEEYGIHTNEQVVHKQLEQLYVRKEDFKKAHYHQGEYFRLEKEHFDLEMNDKMKSFESDSLHQVNQRIKIISTIGQEITASLDMKHVLDLIYEHVNTLMDAAIFGIARINREKSQIVYDMFVEEGQPMRTSVRLLDDKNSLAALVAREKRDIIINDFPKECTSYLPESTGYLSVVNEEGNGKIPFSILCCPLISSDEVTGVIMVQSYEKNAYTISDLDSLKALASYVAIALKNASQAGLIREQNSQLSKANSKLKKDIMLSRQLQFSMIPREFPRSEMFQIYGYFNFLDEVGGDLYDVYSISPDKTVILILDVVGHGVSAALVTAMAKILFYNKSKEHLSASQVVEAVNRELTPITGRSFTYFSLFYGIIHSRERKLEYVNAAHPEPFLLKSGAKPSILTSSSLFVGLKADFVYEQKIIDLDPADRLVLFTDGFFEIKGQDKKRFGEKRLLDAMVRYKSLPPGEAVQQLNHELESCRLQGAEEASDDKMILIVDFF